MQECKKLLVPFSFFGRSQKGKQFYSSLRSSSSCSAYEKLFFDDSHKMQMFNGAPAFLSSKTSLKKSLFRIDPTLTDENYLMNNYIAWMSDYSRNNPQFLKHYFSGSLSTDAICKDFANSCFMNGICLDRDKTLQSFVKHDQLSDLSVKSRLKKLKKKEKMSILGFGLDNGSYEKSLADFLIENQIAESVELFGFDPYAQQDERIRYLTTTEIESSVFSFDVITARWVLHHVNNESRWEDFINCIKHCHGLTLIVEHGFLKKKQFSKHEKLYYLLNATFDVIANIGIRPQYFTDSAPKIGEKFFIEYLKEADVDLIKDSSPLKFSSEIHDVGPNFPNQTIITLSPTSNTP